ncbi:MULTISPECIES: chemotaxis protein CheA [unclassified Achromobacter]|uniref:chemotaxis protein CheA n=1 Tax=unclassified Achromobacter TaxID=2626865 RepID=UPI000B518160|nr:MULTISPECIES: chemotaxis protein CheA [unclassified Achromobacter]OWT75469.1 chemotaxis protein CheA [Achromobacter sp. HZ28]OWT76129.1 chemotaxis protein CheA [Achromobacter sp. HZ34]
MDMDQALQTFITESRELLAEMEEALLTVQEESDRGPAINAIFRAAHTIKGSAGLFGIDAIVEFTHDVESVLDRVREGAIPIDADMVALMLACNDYIGRLVDVVDGGQAQGGDDAESRVEGGLLRERLGAYLRGNMAACSGSSALVLAAGADSPGSALVPAATGTSTGSNGAIDALTTHADHWHISLRFHEGVLRNGMDPLSFIRYLQRLGRITGVACQTGRLPALDDMDPEACYLGFEIGLDSPADKATIEGTFEFVIDDCTIRIIPPHSRISDYVSMLQDLGEEPALLGEMLVRCGTLTTRELDEALRLQRQDDNVEPLGQILVQQQSVAQPVVAAALDQQRQAKEKKAGDSRSVRVDADKLDHLINLVGELITASAGASLAAARTGSADAQEFSSQVADLVEAVRDSTLQLRMVRIGATFNRFRRVVHDVARTLGKRIELVITGEETELDKTVVEKIGDPLTHLVRNAMDHGIEAADVRVARGKPAHGTIMLDARHESGHIVIEVRDDGGGLDRERILAKAVERGIVEMGQVLSDSEVFNLIFEPGFSTAAAVTDLSGRGVGMDVVKRNIEALRGSVDVTSQPGAGTLVTVRLPLTLAIIDGFQVGVGRSRFVLPLDMVDECVAFSAVEGGSYTDLRGHVLPFIRLREMFALPGQAGVRENIVVVRHGSQRCGLVVDTLLGETQAVIKPLARIFAGVRGISGSSILGSGEVALILDVPALMEKAKLPTSAGVAR